MYLYFKFCKHITKWTIYFTEVFNGGGSSPFQSQEMFMLFYVFIPQYNTNGDQYI